MEFIVAVTARIGEYLIVPIGRPFWYVIRYDKNINLLENRIPLLANVHVGVQGCVSAAERAGELVLPNVLDWLNKVDSITEDSTKIISNVAKQNPNCLTQFCCNHLKSRYQLSKKAKKEADIVDKLIREGNFKRVSYPPHPPTLWSASLKDTEVFVSRKMILEGIIDAFQDDEISVIGVYGMGGIGKTTIVKEAANQAMENKLFHEIVITVVSHLPNLRKIQGDIADMLGLNLKEENEVVRASKLRQRLKQGNRILVILDDLWTFVDIKAIGIPRGCKVLLTSRNRDVCNEMNCQISFPVNILSDTDSWNLFKKMINDQVDSPDLYPIATKVAEECGGLPIAIVTVARALMGRTKNVWADVLRQLKSSAPRNIKGMYEKVYKSLELSFDFLDNEELKSCFLLCSLFKEDTDIPIERLARYGVGLGLFQNVHKLDEARDRVHTLVSNLKAACLLLDSESEEYVKMHDVVRDFAISVASNSGYVFLASDDSGFVSLPAINTFGHCSVMSLVTTSIPEFPAGLNCPNLLFCLLECCSDSVIIQYGLFESMKALKVLQMHRISIPSIPQLLPSLMNLRALFLEHCKIGDLQVIGEFKRLEILSLIGSEINKLPKEAGQLAQLRLLDLTDCENLTQIPPDLITRLSRLECLFMRNSFSNWGSEGQATLGELNHLPFLSKLELHIPDLKLLPKDLSFENLVQFDISVGGYFSKRSGYSYPQTLRLRVDRDISLYAGLSTLLKRAQHLILDYPIVDYVKNSKNVVYNLKREGIARLKCLEVYGYNEIQCLVDPGISSVIDISILQKLQVASMANLKVICDGPLPVKSFSNLGELRLSNLPELLCLWKDPTAHVSLLKLMNVSVFHCHNLGNLFLQSAAKDLGQLRTLHIWSCETLKEVFSSENEGITAQTEEIVLANLNSLKLVVLPSLRSFSPALNGNLDSQYLFNKKVIFPALEELSLRELDNVRDIWDPQYHAENFCRLRDLTVFACDSIRSIFSSNLPQRLHNLETLSVEWCGSLEELCELEGCGLLEELCELEGCGLLEELCELEGLVIDNDERNSARLILPGIRVLLLGKLPKLKHLWWNEISHGFLSLQSLNSLVIYGCDELRYVFSLLASQGLVQFQRLEILSCMAMKDIFVAKPGEVYEECNKTVMLPQLSFIELKDLPELTSFCRGNFTFEYSSLKTIKIEDCPKLQTFAAPQVNEDDNLGPVKLPLFNDIVAIPELEELHINGLNELVEIWHNKLRAKTFCKLRVLDISKCSKLLDIGLTCMLPRLMRLEVLYITECSSLEEIFLPENPAFDQDDQTTSLSSLIELRLQDLPKLRQIFCEFQNLRSLEICRCDSLNYIFSPSIARSLVQLRKLKIDSCKLVKEIVGKDRGDVDMFMLPQVQTLELENLPNLTSFCTSSSSLNWPSLKELRIENCSNMRSFISQRIIIPNHSILTQSFFCEKVLFPTLEKLRIDGLKNLRELWGSEEPLEESYSQIKLIEIRKCKNLSRVFPSNLISRLVTLEELSVKHCGSLKSIVDQCEDSEDKIMFPKLHTVRLVDIPNLQSFCCGNSNSLECPSLRKVHIEDCPSMHTFSTGYLVTPNLNAIHVGYEQQLWKGDPNCTVHDLFKGEDSGAEKTNEDETVTD